MPNDPLAELSAKLVLAGLSTAGALTQLIGTLRKRANWSKQAKAEVGSPGKTYAVIITIPHLIYNSSLSLVVAWFFIVLFTGGLILSQQAPPPWMSAVFGYSYWLFVGSFVLIVVAYWNLLSSCLLHLTKWIDYPGFLTKWLGHLSFKPGWVNADWQLNHYKEFFAMNIDVNECGVLSEIIYNDIVAKREAFQPLQAPQPHNVDKDELANYLLFKCFTEKWVNQQRLGSEMVDKSQKYLAWAAETNKHPFKPASLRTIVSSGSSLYEQLKNLPAANGGAQPVGELPVSDGFDTSMQHVVNDLVHGFDGEGSRLAVNALGVVSPYLLLRRLKRFEKMGGHEGDSIRRLFLKLSIRMNVWPKLTKKAGPLLYPQNEGIATLFLNLKCLKVPNDTKQINVTEEGFWKLVAAAEDEIVGACYDLLRAPGNKAAKAAFTEAVFGCDPEQLDRWKLSDYIDLWLFTHTRRCARRKPKQQNAAAAATDTPTVAPAGKNKDEAVCPMLTSVGTCYCEGASKPWRLDGSSFVKE